MKSGLRAAGWVVYTDLDGTLLDHHDYSFAAAEPALNLLREHGIPVILTSSKTFVELAALARRLDFEYPVIGENGAFIAWPDDCAMAVRADSTENGYRFRRFGKKYGDILSVLHQLRLHPDFRFSGFSDWCVEELMEHTGLDRAAAERAQQRQASEPILWEGREEALPAFRQALESQGLQLIRGGRFFHVMGPSSKGKALGWLQNILAAQSCGDELGAIALGDGPNDLDMLEAADIAVVVANPDSPKIAPKTDRLIYTEKPGPSGWNEAITHLVSEIKEKTS